LTKEDKRPTKGGATGCSGSRSRAKRRSEAEEGAPPRAKKTRQGVKNPRSRERPHIPRSITGSDDPDFSSILLHQVVGAQCPNYSATDEQVNALLAAMAGMKPRDEIEGMLCGQLIATHQAAMECYRRAAISKQTFEGWRESLNQANKLCRTYAALAETLDRHRGKGQQRIQSSTSTSTPVDRRLSVLSRPASGVIKNWRTKAVQREKLPTNRATRCGARTRSGKPCRSPVVRGKRRCRMHGGAAGSGAPIGNTNALRHGHYTAEAIARRRQVSELIRMARATLADIEQRR